MKSIASIAAATVLILATSGAQAQVANPWNPAPVATTEPTMTPPVWSNTAPIANPYAPADLEQRLSSGSNWNPVAPAGTQNIQPATPQFAPVEQNPAPSQFVPMQQNQQTGQYTQAPGYATQTPNFGNGSYGGYLPNYGYGGMPGNYGYNIPYGYGTGLPYGNNFGSPFGNGFGGFPFNSGGYGSPYGSQYGNIPSGSSPFFGGSTPFGFW